MNNKEFDYRKVVLDYYDITISEDEMRADLSVYSNYTADQYDVWLINFDGTIMDHQNIDWENEIFMYNENIHSYILDELKNESRKGDTWYIQDEEDILQDWWWEEIYEELCKDGELIHHLEEEEEVIEDGVDDRSNVEILQSISNYNRYDG